MQQKTAKRLSVYMGVLLVAVMGLSTILPTLVRNSTQQTLPPTEIPIPTFPPPIADLSTIRFDERYLHPSGLFSLGQPTGWFPTDQTNSGTNARTTFSNTGAQSIVQVDVDKSTSTAPLTLDDVDARWTSAALASSWSRYSSWKETGQRRRENDQLVMDFELQLNRQTFVARQKSWTDGDWIYSVRVVTPDNATDMLLYVLDGVAASLKGNKEFASTPFDWNAYFDTRDGHIIRYPANWSLSSGAPGQPASLTSSSAAVRIEAKEGMTVADEAAARAWVGASRPGTSILSVQPVTRDEGTGFSVAYGFRDADGESQSGLAVLLNGPNTVLHIANLRFPASQIDLNNESEQQAYSDLAQVMASFSVMPDLELAPTAAAQ